VEGADEISSLPAILQPEACQTVAILPIESTTLSPAQTSLFLETLRALHDAAYVRDIFVLGRPELEPLIAREGGRFIARTAAFDAPEVTLEEVLQQALRLVEENKTYPDIVLYVNYLYPFRPPHLFDELVRDVQYKGLDTVFAAQVDYNNYWAQRGEGNYEQVGDGLKRREQKDPLYKALYGLGTATVTPVIRQGKLVGTRVGILPLDDRRYDLKYEDLVSAHPQKQPAGKYL
jgi:rhamnosyltransferase